MGMNYYVTDTKPTIKEPLHIGKSSIGWRFLFHDVGRWDSAYEVELHTYNQWVDFLSKGIEKGEIVILDEDDEVVELSDLLGLIEVKQSENNPDNFSYAKNIDGYRFTEGEFS